MGIKARPSTPSKAPKALELRIKLLRVQPPVWRHIRVPADLLLGDLHHVLQAAMGWQNCHLHQFRQGDKSYGDGEFELMPGEFNEWNVGITTLLAQKGSSIEYEYDFGDGWLHTVTVTDIGPLPAGAADIELLDGAGACPPEDSGGPHGYMYKLEVMANPGAASDPDEAEGLRMWMPPDFDPNTFDAAAARRAVKNVFQT